MKKKIAIVILCMAALTCLLTGCFGTSNSGGGDNGGGNTPEITYTNISTVSELQGIANQSGNYKLVNDINISGSEWTPIAGFTGLLEGDNYSIQGLTISGNKENIGLFSTLKGKVQNLKVTSVNITGTGDAGTAGALCGTNEGTISNVTASGTINAPYYNRVGGIAGFSTKENINNCTNEVTITAYDNVGGIVGRFEPSQESNATVTDNKNNGVVSGNESVGGIFGSLGIYSARYSSDKTTFTLTNCENTQVISGTGNNIGGIVGNQTTGSNNRYSSWTISSCGNSGAINGKDHTGGIVGNAVCLSTMTSCTNSANITGNNYVGGYIGQSSNTTVRIATNSNTITGKGYVGGIAGYAGLMDRCTNNGEIISTAVVIEDTTSYAYVGGIAGYAVGATSCTNNIDITVSTNGLNVGGIIGRCVPVAEKESTMSDNTNNGAVSGYSYVGGVFGSLGIMSARYSSDTTTVLMSNFENTKAVNGAGNYVGGLIGNQTTGSNNRYSSCTLSSCNNSGVVNGNDYTAGLIGNAACLKSMSSCTNTANITGGNYVGGYVGNAPNATIRIATNNNTITGKAYLGGIAGYGGYFDNCTNNGEVNSTAVIVEDSTSCSYVGGIAGYAIGASSCTNNADISVEANGLNVAGIVGCLIPEAEKATTLSGNINNGAISGYGNVGGIFGRVGVMSARYSSDTTAVTISDCQNTKSVTGRNYNVGGIVGYQTTGSNNTYSSCTFSNCSNSGDISGSSYVGGIIGHGQCTRKETNIWDSNSNTGNISGSSKGSLYGNLE